MNSELKLSLLSSDHSQNSPQIPLSNDHAPQIPTKQKSGVADEEKGGLTSAQAEELYNTWGYNELPVIEIPLWWVFLEQFMGTMPYMLELAIIVSAAVQDWTDFGIILAMLICNGSLGFYEELKAAAALAELTNKMEKKDSDPPRRKCHSASYSFACSWGCCSSRGWNRGPGGR